MCALCQSQPGISTFVRAGCCGGLFCRDCLEEAVQMNTYTSCAYCRQPVRTTWASCQQDATSLTNPQTLLMGALAEGNPQKLKDSVEAGARVDRPCVDGIPPLVYAAATGSAELTTALLTAGADPLKRCSPRSAIPGMTALHMAARKDKLAVANVLINHTEGLALDIADGAGKTPEDYATSTSRSVFKSTSKQASK
mmetsp:Transcript_24235/g.78973  ORF Transcript_24235/g.78973 Transcript_24235/m.78973 type:complete len:196 (+) Transcript_24235:253-840(+)